MKYALIGCGRIAVNHMKAALNNKLEIVAVCDVLPEKMEAILEKYDLQNDDSIKRYTDYKEMIEEIKITDDDNNDSVIEAINKIENEKVKEVIRRNI